MSNRKMNLDRPNLNSEQIRARQNFEQVLTKHLLLKPPVWKSPWFWGPTGLASIGIALFLSVSYINSQNNSNDKTNTLAIKELPKDTECIHPPVKEENVPFQKYEVSAVKDEEIILPGGTKIEIPAGSLIPEDLNQKVEIEVREFPDKVSAFIAGIPMDYDSENAFESAGMIEIRGKQNNEIVALNPEKPIEIDLKLTKNPEGFDFWYLDEGQKTWGKHPVKYSQDEKGKANQPVSTPADNLHEVKSEIARIDKKIETCEEKKADLKQPSVTEYKIPEENHQKFDLDFNKKTYPELAKFEDLVFEIIPVSGYDKTFTKKTWSEVKLEKTKDNYEMIFVSPTDKMRVPVRPVLQGSELKMAQDRFDEAMKDFSLTLDQIEKEKARLKIENEKNRKMLISVLDDLATNTAGKDYVTLQEERSANFKANKWGVYNCDKANPYPEPLKAEVAFAWENSTSPAEFNTLYVFNLDRDMRFKYGGGAFHAISQFGLHPKNDLVLFGIDRDGGFGYCELKSGKAGSETGNIVFSKREEGESVQELLKKLIDETVAV